MTPTKKPVAKPVAAKAAPVAAPVTVAAPAVAVAAPVAPVEAPKAKVQPAKVEASKPAAAIADLMQPFAAIQEQFRLQTEKNAEQLRTNYAAIKGNAELATAKLEESLVAARTGAKAMGDKVIEAVRTQTTVGFEHAKALGAAKSIEDVAKLQQAFVVSQFEAFKAQASEFAAFSTKIANDVTEPAKASLVAAMKR
jgi:hypothetical protein